MFKRILFLPAAIIFGAFLFGFSVNSASAADFIEGIGTHFEIHDSEYLNVVLDSSEEIKVRLGSVPQIVLLNIEASTLASSTNLSLSGLEPNHIYYKYQDDYHNLTEIISNASGQYSYTQDISASHFIFIQPSSSTKFISDNATGGDCTTIGNWNSITKTCTLTGNVNQTIQIDTDGITLNGNGHTIAGMNTGFGVYIYRKSNITVESTIITGFSSGVYATCCDHNKFVNNTFSNNAFGVHNDRAANTTIANNTFSTNNRGIYSYMSPDASAASNNIINSNRISGSRVAGIHLFGVGDAVYNNNIENNERGILVQYYLGMGAYAIYNNNFIQNTVQAASSGGITSFNLDKPTGGNYWSDYDTLAEGCNDVNNDNFCDAPYIFSGGQDNYPWIEQNGWLRPALENTRQFKSDGTTQVDEGQSVVDTEMRFKATVISPLNNQVKLQIELRRMDELNGEFLDTLTQESAFVNSGTEASVPVFGLIDGNYHWQARAVDAQNNASAWQEFGTDQTKPDFIFGAIKDIRVAVILAKSQGATFTMPISKFENDIPAQVKSYFCEVSFGEWSNNECVGGLVTLNFDLITNNGQPFELGQTVLHYGENFAQPTDVDYGTDGTGIKNISIEDVTDNSMEFVWNAINVANSFQVSPNFNNYQMVVVVHEGADEHGIGNNDQPCLNCMSDGALPGVSFAPANSSNERAKNWILLSEYGEVGLWAHEMGHQLGVVLNNKSLCDLYVSLSGCGHVDQFDLMGLRGPHLGNPTGALPSRLSSYSLEELGWFKETVLTAGIHEIPGLSGRSFGDSIREYAIDVNSYYLLEARTKNSLYSDWDQRLPYDALVIYRVTNSARVEKDVDNVEHLVQRNFVNQVAAIRAGIIPAYADPINNLLIDANSFNYGTDFSITAQIATNANFLNRVVTFLRPNHSIYDNIIFGTQKANLGLVTRPQLVQATAIPPVAKRITSTEAYNLALKEAFTVRFSNGLILIVGILEIFMSAFLLIKYRLRSKKIIASALLLGGILVIGLFFVLMQMRVDEISSKNEYEETLFSSNIRTAHISDVQSMNNVADLDLHAVTSDGLHIGVNYATGEYENQIPGAEASGDLIYDEEWIAVPEGTQIKYYVSSEDIEQFLSENPDVAQQLPSTQETYTLTGIYYDSSSNRYESQPLVNQTIEPGQTIIHELTGTTDIEVEPGIVDTTGPTITHSTANSQYILNSPSFNFIYSAEDMLSGLKSISATLDGVTLASGTDILLVQPGAHTIIIAAEDNADNTTTETINFAVAYAFGGYLTPVKADGSGLYNLNRTLPIRLQFTDANNQIITSATAQLFLAKIQDGIVGIDEVPLSTSNADTGNNFRIEGNQYVYNLDTGILSVGTWQVKVVLDDGASHAVIISIQ